MLSGPRLIVTLVLVGLSCFARADAGADALEKRKSVKPTVNSIKQKDGSVIERLDLSVLPGSLKDDHVPATPEEWLSRMLDPTRNGLILKQPKRFAEWLDAVTEPRFMTALATVALDPNSYPKTFNRLLDPATARNWAGIVDPEVFLRWMAAGMDPALYQAVFQHMFDPKKYLRWATYPGYPLLEAPRARTASPNEQVGRDHETGETASTREAWLTLPAREPMANPWLVNGNTYRY